MTTTATSLDAPDLEADDLTIAYIGGGSRQWAPNLVQDLALSNLDGTVRLQDVAHDAAERNAEFGNWVQREVDPDADWTYTAVADRAAALDGADAVILSTQFDPAETFVHDLRIPRDYGIYGAVAATIGPGGIFRAMRTMPEYRDHAAAIREHCPDAWVLNFTNPVHFVTRALYDEFPDINALGLCHEVLGTRSHLADLASEYHGIEAGRSDISVRVKGINHFTWIDDARFDGIDLWPMLEELVDDDRAQQRFSAADLADESPFVDNQQVTWELFRRFGLFPAAGDRHLIEYAPAFIASGQETLNRWGVKRTDADFRAKHWTPSESDQTTDVEAWLAGDREFELTASGEVFADILEALTGGDRFVTNVNLPNRGQVGDLERGAVVETNALVHEGSVDPLTAGGFPRPVRSLVSTHVDTIEGIVAAEREGDLDAAFAAFLTDPQVQTLDPSSARDCFAELVAAEREYLQDWDLDGSRTLAESPEW